ncbi:hypothetical protein C0099_15150 [Pseudazoarcus pumilus]|uniref:DUF342 domain-containing protein n=2 Tax=Pseudazoarcus pumilus TaxID=2067960 RepID=A0A2I6SA82_9RHOO|nr:hypothetical protein C0099_15150 [Pseudazoarcus pumilus]
MVTLVGTGVLAATAVAINAIRGAQDQQLALHANTQAAARAWDGVELLRHYFAAIPDEDFDEFEACSEASPCELSISGVDYLSAAVVEYVEESELTSQRRVVANVTGSGADTTVSVQAIYEFVPPGGGGNENDGGDDGNPPAPLVKINSDLNLTGSINVLGGENANLVVDGNVSMSGSVSGINEICATGNLSIGSAIQVNRICSNANVTLTGAATSSLVEATGDVTLSGGAATNIGTVLANGDVTLSGGSANVGNVRTQGDVSVTGGNAVVSGTVDAQGDVVWSSGRSADTVNSNGDVRYGGDDGITTINARGDVTLTGGGNVRDVNAMANVFIQSYWGQGIRNRLLGGGALQYNNNGNVVGSGSVVGPVSPTPLASGINVSIDPGLVVDVPWVDVPDVRPVTVPENVVDVFALKSAANYVFEIEAATGKKRVTVRDVSGIDDGEYYLGNYNTGGYRDYLCTEVVAAGNAWRCTEPALPTETRTICQGYSDYNTCFSYSSAQNRWTIAGQTMAPGLAWFDGNLTVSNGVYINTFLATGTISTAGGMKTYAPNYAGYQGVCTDNRSAQGMADIRTGLSGLYPTNLCVGGTYEPSDLANVAFIAGGYRSGTYEGGNIALGASNQVFGSVIAGGLLTTGGSTNVVGSIEIANMAGSASPTNWSGSTTIDLRNLPDGFDPDPGCLVDCPQPEDPEDPGGSLPWQVFWTRYL